MIKVILLFFVSLASFARTETYIGKAYQKDKFVYLEKHQVTFDDKNGRVLTSQTEYFDPKGRLLTKLISNYSRSVSAPVHETIDKRFKTRYGLRYQGDDLELYVQDDGKKEESKNFKEKQFSPNKVIAGQGLHYYMRNHLSELIKSKVFPIVILIPGQLDYYTFEVEFKNQKDDVLVFEVHIKNSLLRLFAPNFTVHYDAKKKRLLYYKGLSNLLDDKREKMNVEIKYEF